jgi:hypothetical protein
LHVQINAGVDLVSGCWANKSQRRHYKTLHASEFAFGNGQKKKPRPGETGASFGSFGGERVWGETPLTQASYPPHEISSNIISL